jgi:uncharacterized protein (DUF2235 family)
MGKRIVVCCDGTGNSFDHYWTASNVVKLYSCLAASDKQLSYYYPGVGTMGAPNSRGSIDREWSRIKGLAFGSGLLSNVGDAYRFLMETYVDGDEIFLFGFSRGAFTVRVLASLIHIFGLLRAGNQGAIPYILNLYSQCLRQETQEPISPDEPFKWQFSHTCDVRIKFCGIWDTVSSYGWIYSPIPIPFLDRNPIIEVGRHAVSIHERRCFYRDNLWGPPEAHQDIRQVWFRGVHSDVGGSYEERDSNLSKIALEWMMVEATKHGLELVGSKARIVLGKCKPDPPFSGLPTYVEATPGLMHLSLIGAWWLLEILPQRDPLVSKKHWFIPLGRSREMPSGSFIHESALNQGYVRLPPKFLTEPWVPYDAQV